MLCCVVEPLEFALVFTNFKPGLKDSNRGLFKIPTPCQNSNDVVEHEVYVLIKSQPVSKYSESREAYLGKPVSIL